MFGSTSVNYSTPSKTTGTRFMLVSEVALGNCKDMFTKDLTLTSPPDGYNSVHGVKSTAEEPSDFKVMSLKRFFFYFSVMLM